MKPIRKIIIALAAIAFGFVAQHSNAQTTVAPVVYSGTTTVLASATSGQIITIQALPAAAGNFVFTGGAISIFSGTLTSATPPDVVLMAATSGSTPQISGTVQLTGTSSGFATPLTPLTTNMPLVLTGTAGSGGKTLSLDVYTSGTSSTAYTATVTIQGYYINSLTGGL